MRAFLLLVTVACVAVGFAWWNYDIAASRPHGPWLSTILHETFEHSVGRQARGLSPPAAESIDLAEAAHHYRYMCEDCHGAPGVAEAEIRPGLYPKPPILHEHGEERSQAELFWVVKHGIKFTGMPGYGSNHSDEEIWGIARFVAELPRLDSEAYAAFRSAAESSPENAHHREDNHPADHTP